MIRTVLVALVAFGIFAGSAFAQQSGYSYLVDRQTFTVADDGLWVALFEFERRAEDAEAARHGGRVDLTYSASIERLEILEAVTLKADGRRLPVSDDRILDIAPAVDRAIDLYTDDRTRSIIYPAVEAGDTVRIVYRRTKYMHTWPKFWNMFWNPGVRSVRPERIVEHSSSLRLSIEHHGSDYRAERSGDRIRHVFTRHDLEGGGREKGSISEFDWASRFAVTSFESYAEIGDFYAPLHSNAARVGPDVAALAAEITGAARDKADEARLLYDWVRTQIRYVAVAIGRAKLTPADASETIGRRYGDCKAHAALLAALLAARGIASEPVLLANGVARYTLPDVPVPAFDHVILYLTDSRRYVDSTWLHGAFGALPWGQYDKPVLHAATGASRLARIPKQRVQDSESRTVTVLNVSSDGEMKGTTREAATGDAASDIRAWVASIGPTTAATQLRQYGSPGAGRWTTLDAIRLDGSAEVTAEFTLVDLVDLTGAEPFTPPSGLRLLGRPGSFLVGTHDPVRRRPFPCNAGRQVERIELKLPPGVRPLRLPAGKEWTTPIARYRAAYGYADGKITIDREFVSSPDGQVCEAERSADPKKLLDNVRRDLRTAISLASSP